MNDQNVKNRLETLQNDLQENEQQAQRMEGQLENHLEVLEKEFGTRDLKEIEKLIAEREEENRKNWENFEAEVAEVEESVEKEEDYESE